jgi:DNA-binding phage protein
VTDEMTFGNREEKRLLNTPGGLKELLERSRAFQQAREAAIVSDAMRARRANEATILLEAFASGDDEAVTDAIYVIARERLVDQVGEKPDWDSCVYAVAAVAIRENPLFSEVMASLRALGFELTLKVAP